jgi:hypothetical protein
MVSNFTRIQADLVRELGLSDVAPDCVASRSPPLSFFSSFKLLSLAFRIMREIQSLRSQDHPSSWDEDDVQRWLSSLAVDSKTCDSFSKHSINGEVACGVCMSRDVRDVFAGKVLLALTDDRLKLTIGVSSLGVRQRLVSEIKSLNRRPLPPPPGQLTTGTGARSTHMQMVIKLIVVSGAVFETAFRFLKRNLRWRLLICQRLRWT